MNAFAELSDAQVAALYHSDLPETARAALVAEMARRDADDSAEQAFSAIRDAIVNQPRSLQKRLGPSELGIACDRKIGFRLAGVSPSNIRDDVPWKPFIGTSVHAQLEAVFTKLNRQYPADAPRYLIEHQVDVGEIGGVHITGHCDLLDLHKRAQWDWKVVGTEQLRHYRNDGPSPQYRVQAHLYGRGWQRAGVTVDRVGIVFLPRDRELSHSYIWHEAYDERIALQALERIEALQTFVGRAGAAALPLLPTADDMCRFCPWWLPAATDHTEACPGHGARATGT